MFLSDMMQQDGRIHDGEEMGIGSLVALRQLDRFGELLDRARRLLLDTAQQRRHMRVPLRPGAFRLVVEELRRADVDQRSDLRLAAEIVDQVGQALLERGVVHVAHLRALPREMALDRLLQRQGLGLRRVLHIEAHRIEHPHVLAGEQVATHAVLLLLRRLELSRPPGHERRDRIEPELLGLEVPAPGRETHHPLAVSGDPRLVSWCKCVCHTSSAF